MKVAIIQHSPVFLNLQSSLDKAVKLIEEAATNKSQLIVFGESWFSGYPVWLDYGQNVAFWDDPKIKKVYARMLENSLQQEGPELDKLKRHAKKLNVGLVIGANEYDPTSSKGTLYNSIFTIDEKGNLVNHHRKLVPTFTEKLVHKHGDGYGLRSSKIHETHVTSAICWEHWMPLTRQALHDSHEEMHIALWPKVHEMHQVASRQYAFEGRCFVIAAGQMLKAGDLPVEVELRSGIKQEDWVLNGGSCVIGPDGYYVVEPVFDREEIIYAELEMEKVKEESITLDVSGHYQRKDVFSLKVNRKRK